MNPSPSASPTLSIIVPTHNRSALVRRVLEALSRQSYPATAFEVLVVADACRDETEDTVAAYAAQAPYRLHLLSHRAGSAAATRNLGAAHARGRVLLFLDDDVVPQPGLVQAHVEAQRQNRVVLGYSRPILPAQPGWWQLDARRWWEDAFRAMGKPGHRFTYRDFFSGNVSMASALFHQVGGFDTSFTGRLEDYELGMRLLKTGARLCFVPQAIGHHHESTDLGLWLRRVRQDGAADVRIGQRYPELRVRLFAHVTSPCDQKRGRLRKVAFGHPQRGDRMERLLLRQAALYERLRLRGRWRKLVSLLQDYNYCRGVAETIGDWPAFSAWLQEAPLPPAVAGDAPVVDLAALPAADALEEALKHATDQGLRLALGGYEVLTIPPQPGAEPLRDEHLHLALRELAEQQFVPALAMHLVRSTSPGGLLWQSSSSTLT